MTGQSYELKVQKRTLLGKKSKQLRQAGQLPANIFGDVKESIAIQVSSKDFRKMYNEAGETSVVNLHLEGESTAHPVLVDSVEIDPMSGTYLHVSFRQVNLREKVVATIPVELVGELSVNSAMTVVLREELDVEALPTDLPEAFTIDLGQFTEIGQEFTVAQLEFDRQKVELLEIEPDQVLLQVQALEQMAEVEEASTEVAEVETTEMGKSEEAGEGDKKEE